MTLEKNDRWRYISSGGLWFLWKKKFRHVLPLNCVWGRGEIWRRCIVLVVIVLVLVLVLYLSSLWGREIWHTTHPGPVLFPCHWKEGQLLMPFHYAKIGLRWASYFDHGDDDYHDHHGHDDHAQSAMLLMMMMWTAANAFTLRLNGLSPPALILLHSIFVTMSTKISFLVNFRLLSVKRRNKSK